MRPHLGAGNPTTLVHAQDGIPEVEISRYGGIGKYLAVALVGYVDVRAAGGYTFGMKTAVSIPDEVFRQAERLARRVRKSRSQVYSEALKEYVAKYAPDSVTEAMNRVCDGLDERERKPDTFSALAARRILERTEW